MTTDTRAEGTVSAQGPEGSRALQTQAAPSAVAKVDGEPGTGVIVVRGTAGSPDKMLERIEATITLPPQFQYAIPIRGVKNPDGSWDNNASKVGITSDGYDYLNRALGCSFFFPDTIHDEHGVMQPNPIHRDDYIYLRIGGVWRNPVGQLVMALEDVEVNFLLMYQNKRANATGASVVMGDNGPLWDEAGNMVLKLSPEAELKAYKELTQNRSFGPRYAITVGRIRILKMATGMRSLPISAVRPYPVRVVAFRDMMTPQERVTEAGGDLSGLYGRPVDIKPLTAEEAAEVGLENDLDADERSEQAAVEAAQEARAEEVAVGAAAPVTTGDPLQAPWSAEDLADLDQSAQPRE